MKSTPTIFREKVAAGPSHAGPGGSGGHGPAGHGTAVHHGLAHVVSPYLLVGVFSLLMVLTLITVGVTKFDFGYKVNLIIALAIAVVKAMLVIAYFMHLRYDNLFYTAIVGISLVFIGVFIVTTVIDSDQYQPILAPRPVGAAP